MTKVFRGSKNTISLLEKGLQQREKSSLWMSAEELVNTYPDMVHSFTRYLDEKKRYGDQAYLKPQWNKVALQLGSYFLHVLNKPENALFYYQMASPPSDMENLCAEQIIEKFPDIDSVLTKLQDSFEAFDLNPNWNNVLLKLGSYYLNVLNKAQNALLFYQMSCPPSGIENLSAIQIIEKYPHIVSDLDKLLSGASLKKEWGKICFQLGEYFVKQNTYEKAAIYFQRISESSEYFSMANLELYKIGIYASYTLKDRQLATNCFRILTERPGYEEEARTQLEVTSGKNVTLGMLSDIKKNNFNISGGTIMQDMQDENYGNKPSVSDINNGNQELKKQSLKGKSFFMVGDSNENLNDKVTLALQEETFLEYLKSTNIIGSTATLKSVQPLIENLSENQNIHNAYLDFIKLKSQNNENQLHKLNNPFKFLPSKNENNVILPIEKSNYFKRIEALIQECESALQGYHKYYEKRSWGKEVFLKRLENIKAIKNELTHPVNATKYYCDNDLMIICEQILSKESRYTWFSGLIKGLHKIHEEIKKRKLTPKYDVSKKSFEKIQEQENLIDEKNEIIQKHESVINEQEQLIKEKNSTIENLNSTDVGALNKKYTEVLIKNDDLSQRQIKLKKENESLTIECNSLKQECSTLKQECSTLKNKVNQLEEKIKTQTSQLEVQIKIQKSQLEIQKNQFQNEMNDLNIKNEKLEVLCESLSNQMNELSHSFKSNTSYSIGRKDDGYTGIIQNDKQKQLKISSYNQKIAPNDKSVSNEHTKIIPLSVKVLPSKKEENTTNSVSTCSQFSMEISSSPTLFKSQSTSTSSNSLTDEDRCNLISPVKEHLLIGKKVLLIIKEIQELLIELRKYDEQIEYDVDYAQKRLQAWEKTNNKQKGLEPKQKEKLLEFYDEINTELNKIINVTPQQKNLTNN